MRRTREEKAITLIALIITIVVLLILAAVAINEVTGDGIIQHATNAKTSYEKAQDEENSMISYYQEYLDAKGNLGPWKQEGNKIYMENSGGEPIELEIGDVVSYNPTEGVTDSNSLQYTSKEAQTGVADQTFVASSDIVWKVLGIEHGRLLLMSANDIVPNGNNIYNMISKKTYLYGVQELNNICNIYSYGKGAESARSITVDDINKITGYNPKDYGTGYEGFNEYNNSITYTAINGEVKYETTNGKRGSVKTNSGDISYSGTLYYVENQEWKDKLIDGESKTFKIEAYKYSASKDSSYLESRTINMNMQSSSKEYQMLFKNLNNTAESAYFLASRTTRVKEDNNTFVYFGLRVVSNGGVGNQFGTLNDDNSAGIFCIRAVVTLKNDVRLEKENGSWKII